MKDIMVIMEQTCQKSIRKLCCIYLCYALLLCLFTYFFGMKSGYEIFFLYLPIGVISGVHLKRLKTLIGNGAYDRICLLPMKRNVLFQSELIFVMISWLPIFTILYFVWFLYGMYVQTGFVDVINSFFFLTLSSDMMSFVAPYHCFGFITFLTILCMLTMIIVCNAFASVAWKKQSIALFQDMIGFLLLLCLIVLWKSWLGIILCWIFILIDFVWMNKQSGVRRKQK